MIFIFGGAYQGKLDFAKREYGLMNEDVFSCTESGEIDFNKKCVCNIEQFTLWCVKNKKDAVDFFSLHKSEWENSVLICRDIFCGVVPIDADLRAWREMTGLLCAYLSQQAQSVYRIFCGLEQKLK